jgi:Cu-Zn family superoxide dismutase
MPISDEFTENGHTVQYVERARFEWQPGAWPERWDVLLGRLGATLTTGFTYALPGTQVFSEGVAYDEHTGYYYVSSTGDGSVFRGRLSESAATVFLPAGADERTVTTGMKVEDGLLFVSGGNTGRMFIYEVNSGGLVAKFQAEDSPSFINDVVIGRWGAAYFTDSNNPYLYRVAKNANGDWEMEEWIDFTGTPLVFQQGFNVNGIVASEGGKYLIVDQTNTGKLFRIDVDTKEVIQIDLGGATIPGGDGMVLLGRTLWVVNSGKITEVRLAGDLASGSITMSFTDPTLVSPTTAAYANGRLLVVNSQFNKRGPGLTPDLPFTISSLPTP